MHAALETLAAAALGALAGGVHGFVFGVLTLAWRRARNVALVQRGEPAIKDAIRPPFEGPGLVVGALASAIDARVVRFSVWRALGVSVAACAAALVAVYLLAFVLLAREGRRRGEPRGP